MKFTSEQNKEFWEKVAIQKKDDPIGTHSDPYLVELENHFIESVLKSRKIKNLLDIGCGNGQRTISFSRYAAFRTIGIDYSPQMINQARSLFSRLKKEKQKKISFEVKDIRRYENKIKFDAIISCRCFINQESYKNQLKLFKILHGMLKKKGSLIIAEGSKEGYENLNSLRKKFGLKPIKIMHYNLPLQEKLIFPKIKRFFTIEKISRLGTYYFISRLIHPALVFPKEPRSDSKINDLAMKAELLTQNELNTTDPTEKMGAHLLIHFRKK